MNHHKTKQNNIDNDNSNQTCRLIEQSKRPEWEEATHINKRKKKTVSLTDGSRKTGNSNAEECHVDESNYATIYCPAQKLTPNSRWEVNCRK